MIRTATDRPFPTFVTRTCVPKGSEGCAAFSHLSRDGVWQAVHCERVRQQDARVVQAGLPECTSHGLRKLCLTRFADIEGMDVLSLAAISGHNGLRELQIYIDAADRKRHARRAIELLEKAQKQNTKVSKRASRLDNSAKK